MTHIISDKQITINGMTHNVTAVNGLDRVDINNQLHYLNIEMDKLKVKQSELVQMREMIDHQCEMHDRAKSFDDFFHEMFGG